MTANPDVLGTVPGFKALGFFPADHAIVESSKVYASGAYWNRLRFPAFPAVLPNMSLVAVLQQPFHASYAEHTVEMGIQDADGQDIPGIRVEGQFRASLAPDSQFGDTPLLPLAVNVQGITFERAGDYSFVLKVDGVELARYAFRAMQVFGMPAA